MTPVSGSVSSSDNAIQKQIVLPWSKALEIAYRSIYVRLGRSIITMSGVILAIAFMMSILANGAILRHLVALNDPQINYVLQQEGERTGTEALVDQGVKQEQVWLISLSLLVALIGIVNAMLMSVTERFREIGTMKCLGALDSFIVRLFLIESTFQGLIGAGLGVVLGLLTAATWKTIQYGCPAMNSPAVWGQLLLDGLFALAVGTIIGVAASIYPAYTAARMAPVDAMRADE
mgnify:CR=1 FL=1